MKAGDEDGVETRKGEEESCFGTKASTKWPEVVRYTDIHAFSDTGYTVTVLTVTKWPFIEENDMVKVQVTLAYSDTFWP